MQRTTTTLVTAVLAFAAFMLQVAAADSYSRYRLALEGADETGSPLVLHFHARDGKCTTGWSSTRGSPGVVVTHGLLRTGKELEGRVLAGVGPVEYDYTIQSAITGNRIEGSYQGDYGIRGSTRVTGPLTGQYLARAASHKPLRMKLSLSSMYTTHGHARHPMADIVVREGKVVEGTFASRDPGPRGFQGAVRGGNVALRGDRLSGTIRLSVVSGDAKHGAYAFTLNGRVVCNFVEGSATVRQEGREWGRYGFHGTVHGLQAPSASEGVLVIDLEGGIAGELPLTLMVDRSKGELVKGIARGGNAAIHELDVSGAKLDGENLTGVVTVTVKPAGGFPPGERPVSCSFSLHGKVEKGRISGRFNGHYGIRKKRHGRVQGRILTEAELKREVIELTASPVRLQRSGSTVVLKTDWPSYLGPEGNFSEPSQARLLDDMTRVRLVWESEEREIGFGKANTSAGKSGLGPEFFGLPPGGQASPIVAGGLVVMAYFVPRGDVWDTEVQARMGPRFQKNVWLVGADDVVIGIDAATGRTKWKRVFQDKGINTGAGKRGGWAVTPCAADGTVFSLGTTGRVYALDLATGKPLWESDIGATHERLEAAKKRGLANRRLAVKAANLGRQYGILAVACGVLLVPDWNGGLLGFDTQRGTCLWRQQGLLSGFNGPCPVRIEGKEYTVCVDRKGFMRLIDPTSGSILWTVALRSEHLTQPVASGKHLLVFESNAVHKDGGEVNRRGVLAGYRFDTKGAQRRWILPAEYAHELKLDSGPARRVIPRDGFVYHLCVRRIPKKSRVLLIIREEDGAILRSQEIEAGQFYVWGNRLITVTDITHRPRAANREIWQLHTLDPADFRRLGAPWHVNSRADPVHFATGGYELPVYEAYAGGLMYCRVMGGIRCYDLRAQGKE